MTENESQLLDRLVYEGDGGRTFCGACAPAVARETGYDVGGAELVEIDPAEARHYFEAEGLVTACACCGRPAHSVRGASA